MIITTIFVAYYLIMNKNDILFSIIIPTYNRANMISIAIESILAQTYTNWELIVVDDGSIDNTGEVVGRYDDKRIRYFYKENEERSVARNFGIDRAKGDYLSFLDDDDYYLPEFLITFYEEIQKVNNSFSILMSDEYIEYEAGKRIKNSKPKELLDNPVRMLWLVQSNIRPFIFSRNIFTSDKFDITCRNEEDFNLLIKLVSKYELHYIPVPLSVYILHDNMGTKTKFGDNYKSNAEVAFSCIEDLIYNVPKVLEKIPQNEVFDLYNHKVYGYASAAMKKYHFDYWFYLFKQLKIKGSIKRTSYYYLSLIGRMPLYYLKNLINKIIK